MQVINLKRPTNGIYLDLAFAGGSVIESKPGLAHFLEHMTFCGTTNRSEEQVLKELSNEGIQYNACTDHDYIAYQFHFDKDSINKTTDIMSDILTNASFPEDLFKREQGVILQELARRNSNPQVAVYDLLFGGLYKGSAYALPVIGTEETIKSITREDLIDFYKENLWNANASLAVYGETIPEIKLAETGTLCKRESAVFDESEKYLEKKMDTEASIVAYGWRGYSWLKDSPQEYFDLVILTSILGGSDGRIFKKIRTELGLSYDPSMGFYPQADTGVVLGSFTTTPDKQRLCMDALEEEVKKMVQDGPTQEEVDRKVRSSIKHERMDEDKTHWTGKAARRCVRLSKEFHDNYEEAYKAVTVEAVHNCAKKYLTAEPTVSVVCPK